jgi:hypothetical protein
VFKSHLTCINAWSAEWRLVGDAPVQMWDASTLEAALSRNPAYLGALLLGNGVPSRAGRRLHWRRQRGECSEAIGGPHDAAGHRGAPRVGLNVNLFRGSRSQIEHLRGDETAHLQQRTAATVAAAAAGR